MSIPRTGGPQRSLQAVVGAWTAWVQGGPDEWAVELSWFPGGHNPRILLRIGPAELRGETVANGDSGSVWSGRGPSGVEYAYAPDDPWHTRYLAIVRGAVGDVERRRSCRIGVHSETAEVICRQAGELAGDLFAAAVPQTELALQTHLAARVGEWKRSLG